MAQRAAGEVEQRATLLGREGWAMVEIFQSVPCGRGRGEGIWCGYEFFKFVRVHYTFLD
jgi:hypothetical protein